MHIVVTRSDLTERWSCREGDLLVWLRAPGFMQANEDFRVVDYWYMRHGEHVIVSNRPWIFLSGSRSTQRKWRGSKPLA